MKFSLTNYFLIFYFFTNRTYVKRYIYLSTNSNVNQSTFLCQHTHESTEINIHLVRESLKDVNIYKGFNSYNFNMMINRKYTININNILLDYTSINMISKTLMNDIVRFKKIFLGSKFKYTLKFNDSIFKFNLNTRFDIEMKNINYNYPLNNIFIMNKSMIRPSKIIPKEMSNIVFKSYDRIIEIIQIEIRNYILNKISYNNFDIKKFNLFIGKTIRNNYENYLTEEYNYNRLLTADEEDYFISSSVLFQNGLEIKKPVKSSNQVEYNSLFNDLLQKEIFKLFKLYFHLNILKSSILEKKQSLKSIKKSLNHINITLLNLENFVNFNNSVSNVNSFKQKNLFSVNLQIKSKLLNELIYDYLIIKLILLPKCIKLEIKIHQESIPRCLELFKNKIK